METIFFLLLGVVITALFIVFFQQLRQTEEERTQLDRLRIVSIATNTKIDDLISMIERIAGGNR